MANNDELNFSGLQTKDNLVLVNDLVTGFQDIYSQNGETLNLDSNTPDGQLIELLAFMGTTIREMITEVYNSCDPDKCVGAVQDNRYQINYLTRKQGSYSLQNIAITADKTVELQGLDASYNDPEASAYAVTDNNGNIWYLVDSTTIYTGTTSLEFRAKEQGNIIPTVGTITNQVTIVGGITNVINNVGPTAIGVEEESDSDFRIRRARSTENSSKGIIETIEGQLLALDGVVAVKVHENIDSNTDSTGTLPHFIWAIVEGGANTDIANIIYANIGGAGTRGNVVVPIITSSLQTININFDRENIVPFYIRFDLKVITSIIDINQSDIKQYIADNLIYNIGEDVETSKVTQVCANAMLADGGNGYALNPQVSYGGSAIATVSGSGIISATVVSNIFQDTMGDVTGTYQFIYDTNKWTYNSLEVELSDYGISIEGTPVNNDEINISYTAGTWTDFLQVSSIADKFTIDYNKIYITVV